MNQENIDIRRNEVSSSLLAAITTSGLISQLKVTGIDGTKPIVIALGEESIGEVFTRVSWSGGFANLFIVGKSDSGEIEIDLASIVPPASSLLERDSEPLEIISPESPIAMLAELAAQQKDQLAFNVNFSGATVKVGSVEEVHDLIGTV